MGYTVICGSLNMDLVCRGPRIPKPGETILGYSFKTFLGGKGSNQAVAHSRLGGETYMIGCVGNDSYGREMINSLENEGINVKHISKVNDTSGTAHIMVEDSGENNIVVIPGANNLLTRQMILDAKSAIEGSSYLLAQLESPSEIVEYFFELGRQYNKLNILNPAPMPENGLSDDILSLVDVIIPNETEMEILTNIKVSDLASFQEASKILHQKGVKEIICTVGALGSFYSNGDEIFSQKAYMVKAVDTTCAGDSYIGAVITCLGKGFSIKDAMEFASKVASMTVTKEGAQTSIPYLNEI